MQAVIFCGIQGTGKSTFYVQRFFDTHVRINLDMLRARHREWLLLRTCIKAKQPFMVDNTNPTAAERARYILPAKDAGFRVIGYFFDAEVSEALARNARREGKRRVHPAGVYGTRKRLQVPSRAEGFHELYCARITGEGQFSVERMREEP
jgi:predicted kinase